VLLETFADEVAGAPKSLAQLLALYRGIVGRRVGNRPVETPRVSQRSWADFVLAQRESTDLEQWLVMSIPTSRMASSASGFTRVGLEPALCTWATLPSR
jgi:hypothetical protein